MDEDINKIKSEEEQDNKQLNTSQDEAIIKVASMYKDWFLDYASYVILERAVPSINDGLKPVQRRIMHSMKDLDDGRYNKVANIIGHTMQYHPHGDASISDAMVQIGQKELMIDMQGNWGNILTGDKAAAARYIEARLSKFALEVAFNPKTTRWQLSYDGRKKEPMNLPVKFPLLLAQGAEGIAVGLSTKILSHNFNELIDASIKYLKGRSFTILPDFLTGGIADFSNYKNGMQGGKVKVRAKISKVDKKTLAITEIPFGTTTQTLIDSIVKANEKGKIRIKKIEDNTAAEVEIIIHLPPNVSIDKTIDALYTFTNCENSISPLCCVIDNNKPVFLGVSQMLEYSTDKTLELLKLELIILLNELEDQWHFATLERIFIEKRIYRLIEEEQTWKGVLEVISSGLNPYLKQLKRNINEDDIIRLTEIRIKKISKFDIIKAKNYIETLEEKIVETKTFLENLKDFAISYFKKLKTKYGKGKERKTIIRTFENIVATKVAMNNTKLYAIKDEGFIGTSLKKHEFITDCSDIDDIIVFRKNGTMLVTKIGAKTFVGKDIIHISVFKKKDKRTVYNYIYRHGLSGPYYIKRFNITAVTRDKEYNLASANGSLVSYFSANPNGEAEVVTINLKPTKRIKKRKWDIDFSEVPIKGRLSRGKIITKNIVKSIDFKLSGVSTLKPRKIWFDEAVQRLNIDKRGSVLGEFKAEDKLLLITDNGKINVLKVDLSIHFENNIVVLEKWDPKKVVSAVYYNGEKRRYYIKRFLIETTKKEELFITDHPKSKLEFASTKLRSVVEIVFSKPSLENIEVNIDEFISVKGLKALGNKLTTEKIKKVNLLSFLPSEKFDEEEVVENSKSLSQTKLF